MEFDRARVQAPGTCARWSLLSHSGSGWLETGDLHAWLEGDSKEVVIHRLASIVLWYTVYSC